MKLLNDIKRRGRFFVIGTSLGLIAVIGLADYMTGNELAFSLFYVFPIALTTWGTTERYGVGIALLGTVLWLAADIQDGYRYNTPLIHYWNAGIRFGFFIVIVHLLSAFQRAHEHESELARTDSLTGVSNSRHFQETLKDEIARSRRYRHPFTLIYMDVDDFKALNDQYGHSTGDEALIAITHFIKIHLRQTDIIARLGGDEFVLLLAETDESAARSVVAKLQQGLAELAQSRHWQITFSLGVLTCLDIACNPDEAISAADHLMYAAKQNGKNSAVFRSGTDSFTPAPSLPRISDARRNRANLEMENS